MINVGGGGRRRNGGAVEPAAQNRVMWNFSEAYYE